MKRPTHLSQRRTLKLLRFRCLHPRSLLLSGCLLLAACARIDPPAQSGELVVAVREVSAFFQRDGEHLSGFEHDLVDAFAQSLGYKARFVTAADVYHLHDLASAARVHMAASMAIGSGDLQYSAPIRSAVQIVVGHDEGWGPEELADLGGQTVEVVAGSPLADMLRGLEEKTRPLIIEVPGIDEIGLLARVAEHPGSLVAVHETHLDLAVNFHPDLRALLRLPGRLEFAWAFGGSDADGIKTLRAQADAFIEKSRTNGTLARIHDRYFGHLKRINAGGMARFIDQTHLTLPAFRRDFHAAQELTGIDWRLLAALAYQESKWDPLATSPTGVRGMMMLTEDTADHLRVGNRLDAAESIRAGARYLTELLEQVPATAPHPDRLWLALSAYNLGMGHFRGARAIAQGMKRNADNWYEMKQVLPLLARPEVYARLKSGRARGGEAVIMVENIRSYYDVLKRLEPAHSALYAPGQTLKRR
jgi:membrane-bound lytic murein transglycosylase F